MGVTAILAVSIEAFVSVCSTLLLLCGKRAVLKSKIANSLGLFKGQTDFFPSKPDVHLSHVCVRVFACLLSIRGEGGGHLLTAMQITTALCGPRLIAVAAGRKVHSGLTSSGAAEREDGSADYGTVQSGTRKGGSGGRERGGAARTCAGKD